MKTTRITHLFAALSLSLAGAAFAHNEGFRMTFTAELTGDQVVPKVTTEAKGVVGFTFNGHGDSVSFHGGATRLSGPITNLTLYSGEPGAKGTKFHDISKALKGNLFSGNLPTSVAEIGKFMRGTYYLVVATAANPDGEIRGHVTMARNRQYIAELNGDNAVPKATTTGSGFGAFYLSPDDSILTVRAVFGGLKDSVTSVHFGYGKADAADAVNLDLTSHNKDGIVAASIKLPAEAHAVLAKGSKKSHVEWAENIEKGEVYFTVRTKAHTTGEIRGQVAKTQERIFIAEMNGAKNVPVSNSTATGLTLFRLSDDDSTLTAYAAYSGLDSIASVHLHRGSRTANADTLPTEPQADWKSSLSGSYLKVAHKVSSFSNPGNVLKDLYRASLYTNVHTKAYPTGAIRSQILVPFRIGAAFFLEGAQETPAVTTKAFGAGVVTMDPDSGNVQYSLVADSLGSAFTLAHFHKQVEGTAGGVVLDIGPAFKVKPDTMTGLIATGLWVATQPSQPFTKALAKAFAAESLYVNIHSKSNGAGEIRGQIKDRIPDTRTVRIRALGAQAAGSRLHFGAGANSLRLEASPGSVLRLSILDLRGRSAHEARLTVGASGFSRDVDLGLLKSGLYVASWSEGSRRKSVRFLRH